MRYENMETASFSESIDKLLIKTPSQRSRLFSYYDMSVAYSSGSEWRVQENDKILTELLLKQVKMHPQPAWTLQAPGFPPEAGIVASNFFITFVPAGVCQSLLRLF